MKDHIQVSRLFSPYELEGTLDEALAFLVEKGRDLIDPRLYDAGSYDSCEFEMRGWRPMTEKELERQKARRKRDKETNNRRKQAAEKKERELLAQLAKKYPDVAEEALYLEAVRAGDGK